MKPFALNISGSVTVPAGRCSFITSPFEKTWVDIGRSPVRNEVRDGLQQIAWQ